MDHLSPRQLWFFESLTSGKFEFLASKIAELPRELWILYYPSQLSVKLPLLGHDSVRDPVYVSQFSNKKC